MSCISPELEPLSLALANLISLSPRALSSFIHIGVPHKLKTHNQALDSLLLRTSLLQSTPHEPKALALLRQCEGCTDTAQPEAEPLHPQSPMSMWMHVVIVMSSNVYGLESFTFEVKGCSVYWLQFVARGTSLHSRGRDLLRRILRLGNHLRFAIQNLKISPSGV